VVHNVKLFDRIIHEFRKFVHDVTRGHRNYTDIGMIKDGGQGVSNLTAVTADISVCM
jgi:hypothetical protein